jgi:hypothetical protein
VHATRCQKKRIAGNEAGTGNGSQTGFPKLNFGFPGAVMVAASAFSGVVRLPESVGNPRDMGEFPRRTPCIWLSANQISAGGFAILSNLVTGKKR